MSKHTNTPYSVDEAGRILDSKGFIVADVDNPRVLREWDKKDVDHWSQLPGVTYFDIEEEEEFALAELFASAPDMAEELERAKDLIATYERDRTRHLLLIEGADTDLAELGESLGREIEQLKACLDGAEATGDEMAEKIERLYTDIRQLRDLRNMEHERAIEAEAQRDELLTELREIAAIAETATVPSGTTFVIANKARNAIAKATP